MKVIHIISGGDSGGAKTHVHTLLKGLNQFIQADMVCFMDGPFVEDARKLGIQVKVIPGNNPLSVLRKLKDVVVQGEYEIAHCHGARGNLMGALLKYVVKIPVVTTIHSDPQLDYMGRFLGNQVFGRLNKWALHMIPYHIGVSDSMVDLMIDRGIIKKNFFSIYNGIEFTPIPPREDRLQYLRNLGAQVDENSVVIGIAARLNPVKDMSTLIRGFAAAYKNCPHLRLVIAGDGEERELLEALASELGVENYVTFAGWIDGGMDRFYAALDINALTSLSETFPYALTDGTRFHLATVASNVGGIPNLIDDGVNGLLFTPGDWQTLGSHFALLGNNYDLRRNLGDLLHTKASSQFSLDKTIETQLDIYHKILIDWAWMSSSERKGAVICGAYGRGNAGDEAILQAIIAELRSFDPHIPICVLSRLPRNVRKLCRAESIYTFNYFAYRKRMAKAKLYINGGGSLIQDVTSRRSLWFYLSTLKTARSVGCKVMMYGCGIGPLRHAYDSKFAAKIINQTVDTITLRDPHSLNELETMGVSAPKMVLAADPTVSLPTDPLDFAHSYLEIQGSHHEENPHYLGVTVRPWSGFESKAAVIASAIEYVYDTYHLIPIFIPIEAAQDTACAEKVASFLTHTPYTIISDHLNFTQTISLFSCMDLVLSMRLHALIFSAIHGVSLVGIVYDPKVSSFLDSIGQDLYMLLESLDQEQLKHLLDIAAARVNDRDALEEKALRLIDLEKNNLIYAEQLLN